MLNNNYNPFAPIESKSNEKDHTFINSDRLVKRFFVPLYNNIDHYIATTHNGTRLKVESEKQAIKLDNNGKPEHKKGQVMIDMLTGQVSYENNNLVLTIAKRSLSSYKPIKKGKKSGFYYPSIRSSKIELTFSNDDNAYIKSKLATLTPVIKKGKYSTTELTAHNHNGDHFLAFRYLSEKIEYSTAGFVSLDYFMKAFDNRQVFHTQSDLIDSFSNHSTTPELKQQLDNQLQSKIIL